jgi:trigger factor
LPGLPVDNRSFDQFKQFKPFSNTYLIMPTVVRQDIDNSSAILTVTVTREELKPKLDSELKKYRKNAPVKGFRPGQVPMEYVKKLYGAAIFGDALNDLLTEQLYNYLHESKIDVLGQPLPTEDQDKFSFKINDPDPEYAVKYEMGFVPQFEIKGIDNKSVYERYTIANLEELAEEDLKYALKRMGGRPEVSDDIQDNDMVLLDARELDGDAVKEGGLAVEINVLVNAIEDQAVREKLLTLKKGDVIRFNARTLENHEKEANYRKYLLKLEPTDKRVVGEMFEASIKQVNRVKEAEMDEEFFKNYFGNDSIKTKEAAIEELKKGISGFYDIRANAMLMREFQEGLMEKTQIDLPDKFLKRWLKANNQGKLSEETVEKEYPVFVENLRWTIIRDKIKAENDIKVTEEELRESFAKKVRSYFGAQIPEQYVDSSVDRLMENEKDVEDTRSDLETDKVFEVIRARVTVKDKPIPSEEFHKILDELTAKAKAQQEDSNLVAAITED